MPQPIPDLSRDQQCHHYQAPSGQRCGSPALKSEYYCYHHLVKHNYKKMHRVLIDPEITGMEIPPIEDRASIFVALAAVLHRLAENTIDTRRAGQMIYGLQVAMQALPPVPAPRQQARPAAETPHDASSTATSTAVEPAPNNQQPTTSPVPVTIPITKESLLYFLRSRHCYNCNAELFPAEELTERRNAGAPPEVIEEARRTLPAQVGDTLPTLQAVAQVSPVFSQCESRIAGSSPEDSYFRLLAYSFQARSSRIEPLCPEQFSNAIELEANAPNLHSPPALLYTHLGARYPRDLRIQSGACLHEADPNRIDF